MTQQQRDANKKLKLASWPIFEYWIKEAEAQRIRADKAEQEAKHQENRALRYSNDYHEACRFQLQYGRQAELAEQERDKLIKNIQMTINLLEDSKGALTFDKIAEMLNMILGEGSNTDAKRD